jgi:tryptophan synthase beta subunit
MTAGTFPLQELEEQYAAAKADPVFKAKVAEMRRTYA